MGAKEKDGEEYLDAGNASFLELMNELTTIRGYKAAGIMACDGVLLYSNTAELTGNHNLSVLMRVLNKLFSHASSLTENASFGSCSELALRTSEEILTIRCSCKESLLGVRIFVLLEDQGNIPLLQRQLEKLLPRLMRCLTWEPDNLIPLYLRESLWRNKAKQPGLVH